MLAGPRIHVYIFCLLLLLPSNLMVMTTDDFNVYPRIHVYVTNGLSQDTLLTLHCKSRDDDLGVHYLKYKEDYTFSFHYNIFRLKKYTLFWCDFTWNGKLHTFEVYNWKRDTNLGRENFRWLLKEKEPCLFNYALRDYTIATMVTNRAHLNLYNLY
ncbi:unnamed protein product [Lupinus luteus]|uniref:S-protein homolog n=1 Tax=Lupinus luteus TaxID=3873 RepID=A0AAV1WNH2_LUPLU